MNSDLISRQGIIDEILERVNTNEGQYNDYQLYMFGLFTQMIQEQPAVEQKTGKWKPWKAYWDKDHTSWTDELKCSECGYQWGDEEYKYCPICGSKMEA